MVVEINLVLDKEKGSVFLDSKPIDYDCLQKLTKEVIDNGKTYSVTFQNFEEVPDLEVYYKEIFDAINVLGADPEIIQLKQEIAKIPEEK